MQLAIGDEGCQWQLERIRLRDRLVKPFKLPVGEASTAEPVNGQPIDIQIQDHPIGVLDGWICQEPAAVVLRIAIEEEIGNFVFSNLSSILTLNFYRSRNSMNE